MMASGDQKFCLRWNHHQTTLTSIFAESFDGEELFDCTIAAEGHSLRAHRLLLSACSPYFKHLLGQHSEGNPIFILKDVKFKELQALVDYMYRGEVTISQDDIASLLLVAENLQIKGLSETTARTDDRPPPGRQPFATPAPPPPPLERQALATPAQLEPQPLTAPPSLPIVPRSGPGLEHRRSNNLHTDRPSTSAEAPGPRKRKRVRRRSSDDESGSGMNQTPIEQLNSSYNNASTDIIRQSMPRLQVNSTALPNTTAMNPQTMLDRPIIPEPAPHPVIVHKTEPPIEQVLVPKQEVDDMADDSANYEDLTLDDDMLDDSQPGPSHGSEGSNSQGFPPWQMGAANGSMDQDSMQEPDAAGGSRDGDTQGNNEFWPPVPQYPTKTSMQTAKDTGNRLFKCEDCPSRFKLKKQLTYHMKHDCGQFHKCPDCPCTFRGKQNLLYHQKHDCGQSHNCPDCPLTFTLKRNLLFHKKHDCGKSHNCPDCHKSFTAIRRLQSHKRYDCGRFHKCPDCPSTFNTRGNLIYHRKNDCGRTHECPYCYKTFQQRTSLNKHIKYLCDAPRVECKVCLKWSTLKKSCVCSKQK